ncbi:ROK family protein [Methylocystis bryophila]|uniref:Transcriptional regulator n=1 Tax=Methylocystis bryophila TaxID=655015 RepID=A0A1W6MSM2_9HYPH|nr:ROK family protein [Methylocystis bryophila]ARN80555.1 transcriptional regulator [Methylocystis bryophila]BDV40606.1 N-acetylglucosamine kinase [Methylocystis bryophila]
MSSGRLRVGVDLGGTKTEAIAIDPSGAMLLRRRVPTPASDYAAILTTIVALVHAIEAELGGVARVGVGVPGWISPRSGFIRNSNTLVLNQRPFAKDLEQALARETRIENDANCFALSEATDGAAQGRDVVFGVILGTGVGGGLTLRGALLRGANAIAGEWGHNPLPRMSPDEFPGPRCYCGRMGCIETFLCGGALALRYGEKSGESVGAEEVARRADHGEALALDALDSYRDRLARALASVVNIVDPDMIVLGGGVSNIDRLYEGLEKLVGDYAFTDALATPIVRNRHGDSSGVRGAAWLWEAG